MHLYSFLKKSYSFEEAKGYCLIELTSKQIKLDLIAILRVVVIKNKVYGL